MLSSLESPLNTNGIRLHLRTQDNNWILALEVPHGVIQRLSHRPLKWLRFVAFAILGARGHLSHVPDGPTVNYNDVALDVNYYYSPEGEYHLVDLYGFNDRITGSSGSSGSVLSESRVNFCDGVRGRDGHCVVTEIHYLLCDAAHILPHSKGDEVSF